MSDEGHVLVTGANGFVGTALSIALAGAARPATRQPTLPGGVVVPRLDQSTDWTAALRGCSAVVHLAARVHHTTESATSAQALYRQTNSAATLNLAEQAASAGIGRFVFMSSAKVHGEGRFAPYREHHALAPVGAYAMSKAEAEAGLADISERTGMAVSILRPPLVYGPGVQANFLQLLDLVSHGIPLPLGAVTNARSMVSLDNLVSAIQAALATSLPRTTTFLVADDEALSTPDLIRQLAAALRRPARLWSLSPSWLAAAAALAGRREQLDKLVGTFTLDTSHIRAELGWRPSQTTAAAIAATADWYVAQHSKRASDHHS